MCPEDLLKKITKKTKVVILVHMLGSPGYVSKIRDISNIKNNNMFDDPFLDINKELIKFGSKIGFWNLEHALEIIVGEYYKKMFT